VSPDKNREAVLCPYPCLKYKLKTRTPAIRRSNANEIVYS